MPYETANWIPMPRCRFRRLVCGACGALRCPPSKEAPHCCWFSFARGRRGSDGLSLQMGANHLTVLRTFYGVSRQALCSSLWGTTRKSTPSRCRRCPISRLIRCFAAVVVASRMSCGTVADRSYAVGSNQFFTPASPIVGCLRPHRSTYHRLTDRLADRPTDHPLIDFQNRGMLSFCPGHSGRPLLAGLGG